MKSLKNKNKELLNDLQKDNYVTSPSLPFLLSDPQLNALEVLQNSNIVKI